MPQVSQDELEIRQMIENWALWRDAGEWERLRTIWHEGGTMQATWFYGTGDEFIEGSKGAWARGVEVLHTLSGTSIDLRGDRAVAQTKMAIHQRAPVEGVLCDCVCMGRFFDMFEKRGGRWGLVLRQPIYEKDWITPVDPAANVVLDGEQLAKFPAGYRHLAYMQTKAGMNVKLDLPGTRGPAVEALYAQGKQWLADAKIA